MSGFQPTEHPVDRIPQQCVHMLFGFERNCRCKLRVGPLSKQCVSIVVSISKAELLR